MQWFRSFETLGGVGQCYWRLRMTKPVLVINEGYQGLHYQRHSLRRSAQINLLCLEKS